MYKKPFFHLKTNRKVTLLIKKQKYNFGLLAHNLQEKRNTKLDI